MVWDGLHTEETEDYYEIDLSYRPDREFRGRAGVEHFTIDKAGPIELRQIIIEPRQSDRFILGVVVIVAVLSVGAIVGSLFVSGALTNDSTPLTVSVSMTPNASARLDSPDGNVTVNIVANTVDVSSELTYTALSTAEIPVLPTNVRATGKAFNLTTTAPLLRPIIITIALSAADAALATGNESNIVIQQHRAGAWVPLPTVVDFGASKAIASVDSLSILTLAVVQPGPTLRSVPPTEQTAIPTAAPIVLPTLSPTLNPDPSKTPIPTPTVRTAFEQSEEKVQGALDEISSTLRVRGDVIGDADASRNWLDTVKFTLINGDQSYGAADLSSTGVVITYMDENQALNCTNGSGSGSSYCLWTASWIIGSGDWVEPGEQVDLTVDLSNMRPVLRSSKEFTIQVKPNKGAVLLVYRTTPAEFKAIQALK
jgi:archaellin